METENDETDELLTCSWCGALFSEKDNVDDIDGLCPECAQARDESHTLPEYERQD